MMAFYIHQLQQHIHQLNEQINSLENRIHQLEQQTSPKTTIEKLEYHFDQLKIERLDGTLHIGVTPEDLNNIDEFSVPGASSPQVQSSIHQILDQHIEQEIPPYMEQLEQHYNYPLEPAYRKTLLDDLKNQLSSRIAYYQNANVPPDQLQEHILSNVKNELQLGLKKWFENNKK